jgi:hypothetical protein
MNNKLTEFNTGGTHSENKYGGIPIGSNATVEENESKKDNFIYSDRIPINEDTIKQFNLPNYIKNKSISGAAKSINDKFKDRQDKYATETKNTLLDRLAQAQESIKAQEAQMNQSMMANSQQVPDMMNGEIPAGMEEFTQTEQMFMGGEVPTEGVAGAEGMDPMLSAGTKMLPSLLSGDKNQMITSGVETGFGLAGTAIGGPVGGMIGSTVGKVVSPMISKLLNDKKQQKMLNQQAIKASSTFSSDFAYGGPIYPNFTKVNPYEGELGSSKFDYPFTKFPSIEINDLSERNGYSNPNLAPDPKTTNMGRMYPKADLSKVGDYLDKNGGKFLKYAPVAMNAYQLSKLKPAENKRLDRMSGRYNPEYVDEKTLQNIAGNDMDNTVNAITQSGGSQGAVRNAILGAGLNRTKGLSNAYISANAQNRATNDKAQSFNSNIDQFNAQTQHQEQQNWEQNEAAVRNEKSKYLAAIGNDLGEVGKEEVNKNQIAESLGYSWDGKYMVDKKTGEKIAYEDAIAQSKMQTKAYGGFIKMNKIGRK